MVNVKTNLSAENICGLKIENVTGFKSSDNPTGFLITGDVSAALKEYHINDVFFFTFLVKNNYDGSFTNLPIDGNVGAVVSYDSSKTFDVLMDTAGINQHTLFKEDGYYSVFQLAIPKESIIGNVESIATNSYYVKTDGTVWVKVAGKSDAQVDLYNLLLACTTNWSTNNIVMLKSNMVSKCFLEGCFNLVLEVFSKYYVDPYAKETLYYKTLREKRDLLYAVTNTIQYYVELGQYYQASKLIHDIAFCNVCSDFVIQDSASDCNCHG